MGEVVLSRHRMCCGFVLLLLVALVGCNCGPTERACKEDADCAQNAPKIYCTQGICSVQACTPGQTQSCYEGPAGSANKGRCGAGRQYCLPTGQWSACAEQQLPQQEICDREDNDCDGEVDEAGDTGGCDCKKGARRKCYAGPPGTEAKGTCKAGEQFCAQDNRWGRCLEQIHPVAEVCDQKDNDCNGQVDDGIVCTCKPGERRECSEGSPECRFEQHCQTDNTWGACVAPPAWNAPELCNGKDDNCNGKVDEDFVGVGMPCRVGQGACEQLGTIACNDDGSAVACNAKPGTPEIETCNGKDDDCDGEIDEDFADKGTSCTAGQGACLATGKQVCNADGSGLECGAKAGTPGTETCNEKDDDCDGEIDEGCECKIGEERPCLSAPNRCSKRGESVLGLCKAGVQRCPAGTWGACEGEILPEPETCNDKDDDCDGKVDEDFGQKDQGCTVGQGSCVRPGKYVCTSDGAGVECDAKPGAPSAEICDGQDNDCDGIADEDFTGLGWVCNIGQGRCRQQGRLSCLGPNKVGCLITKPTWPPVAELCADMGGQGLDDDCDGEIDEDCPCTNGATQTCYTGSSGCRQGLGGQLRCTSPCKTGTQTCTNGKWGPCTGALLPSTEVCNGKDDDCDGEVDEDFARKGKPCYAGLGACRKTGTYVCSKGPPAGLYIICDVTPGTPATQETCNGKDDDCDGHVDNNARCPKGQLCLYGRCMAEGPAANCCEETPKPAPESCDNQDNDCDGQIDESWPLRGRQCLVGIGGCINPGVWRCNTAGTALECSSQPNAPTAEICNGQDDDCDGLADEDFTDKGQRCVVGQGLCRRQGRKVCTSDGTGTQCSPLQAVAQQEICNGLDDDCDGEVDEDCTCTNGATQACYTGATGCRIDLQGKLQCTSPCSTGTQTCTNGKWGTCSGETLAQTDICNGKDDDCDGTIDEDFGQKGQACQTGLGECNKTGVFVCKQDGLFLRCDATPGTPGTETCNGKDDDCDGTIDNGNLCPGGMLCRDGECKAP